MRAALLICLSFVIYEAPAYGTFSSVAHSTYDGVGNLLAESTNNARADKQIIEDFLRTFRACLGLRLYLKWNSYFGKELP